MLESLLSPPDETGLAEALLGPLPFLSLPNVFAFPGFGAAWHVTSGEGLARIAGLAEGDFLIAGLSLDPTRAAATIDDHAPLGVVVRIGRRAPHALSGEILEVLGICRVRLLELRNGTGSQPTMVGRRLQADEVGVVEAGSTRRRFEEMAAKVIALEPGIPDEVAGALSTLDPLRIVDLAGAHLITEIETLRDLLVIAHANERVERLNRYLEAELAKRKATAELNQKSLEEVWPMRANAAVERERRLAAGAISPEEAVLLASFAEKGYVVFEGAIEDELTDALLSDLRAIKDSPGSFLSTDHRRNRGFRVTDEHFDEYESVFDLYVNLESSRRVCFHPKILRFLELVFDERPVAFQQLLFQRSNQHPLHQDTAYVCVQDPLQLVASWVALEDVVPGRGELTYFEGSHRIPHRFFQDGSKRFTTGTDDAEAATAHLVDSCAAGGHEQKDFHAKKGDVFIWAADLVHGSQARTRPEEETRFSCVTHYCPESRRPFWTLDFPQHQELYPWGDRALIMSSHYRDFGGSKFQRPDPKAPLTV